MKPQHFSPHIFQVYIIHDNFTLGVIECMLDIWTRVYTGVEQSLHSTDSLLCKHLTESTCCSKVNTHSHTLTVLRLDFHGRKSTATFSSGGNCLFFPSLKKERNKIKENRVEVRKEAQGNMSFGKMLYMSCKCFCQFNPSGWDWFYSCMCPNL